jgi:hypothetical protein
MIYGPGDCQLPAVVWDVLKNEAIPLTLYVDTDSKEVVVASVDEKGATFVRGDEIASERIKFQAIYPWPLTGRPHLFNCYCREAK